MSIKHDKFPFTVGLTGPAGAGKSTIANNLVKYARAETKHVTPKIISFAGPVKKVARYMGWDGKKDERGRRLLQLLGTECGRQCIREDIWIRRWEEEVWDSVLMHGTNLVIADDVRFYEEARFIKDMGGIVCKVEPDFAQYKPLNSGHVSEQGVTLFDWVYRNETASAIPNTLLCAIEEVDEAEQKRVKAL